MINARHTPAGAIGHTEPWPSVGRDRDDFTTKASVDSTTLALRGKQHEDRTGRRPGRQTSRTALNFERGVTRVLTDEAWDDASCIDPAGDWILLDDGSWASAICRLTG